LIVVRVAAEGTAHQLESAVETGGLTVGLAYESACTAADKAHSDFCHWNTHRNASLFLGSFRLENLRGCNRLHRDGNLGSVLSGVKLRMTLAADFWLRPSCGKLASRTVRKRGGFVQYP
jgi:hypothetical protein